MERHEIEQLDVENRGSELDHQIDRNRLLKEITLQLAIHNDNLDTISKHLGCLVMLMEGACNKYVDSDRRG